MRLEFCSRIDVGLKSQFVAALQSVTDALRCIEVPTLSFESRLVEQRRPACIIARKVHLTEHLVNKLSHRVVRAIIYLTNQVNCPMLKP